MTQGTQGRTQGTDRLPPHSGEIERAVLGCCLLGGPDAGCVGDAVEGIESPEVFYELKNRSVWEAIERLYRDQKGVDVYMVCEMLRAVGKLEECGGIVEVAQLPDKVASGAQLPDYLERLRELAQLRRMLRACIETVTEIYDPPEEEGKPAEILARGEHRVMKAAETRLVTRERSMRELMREAVPVLENFRRGHKMMFGPGTGFNQFDNIMPGMAPGQMIVIAARPGTGKSALMMQVAEHVCMTLKKPVGVFSMEMTGRALGLRELFQRAGAAFRKFSDGFMVESDVVHLTKTAVELSGAPWFVQDAGRMTIEDMEVQARRMKREKSIEVLFIDYLQLMSSRARRWNNRNDEMGEVSMRIKALAKELNIPIFCLAQMNRQSEMDGDRKPRLSDLRESGNIEQDADLVGFLWRPKLDEDDERDMEFLNRVGPVVPKEWRETWGKAGAWKEHLMRVNLSIEKQREGPTGLCSLVFLKPWVRFVDAYNPTKS